MNKENNNSRQFDSGAENNAARLDLLFEIGRVLASSETMNEAAPQILEAICRQLQFEFGELWLLGKDETNLHLEGVWYLQPSLGKFAVESHSFKFPIGEGLPGKVWAKRAPVWLEDIGAEDLPRRAFFAETALQSGFGFPILHGEHFIGAFSFFSQAARRADDALLEMFAAVGSNLGQFVKRERVERNLRESEERYRAFIKQSTEGIWRFELDEKFSVRLPVEEQIRLAFERGYLAECNDAMARMYGLERAEDLVGSRLAAMLDESDAADVKYIRSFVESGYNLIDAKSREKDADGNFKFFLNSLIGTVEDDFLIRVWGTQRDITAQKRAEQTTRESEESYRIVAETASDAIIKIDTNSRILFVNSAVSRIFGYTVEEMLGQSLTMIMPEEMRARHRAGFQRYLETGERRLPWAGLEIPALHKNGHTFPLEISFGEYNERGERFFIGIARDITERKRSEENLKYQKTLLESLTESVLDGILIVSPEGKMLQFNRQFLDIWNFPPEVVAAQSDETALAWAAHQTTDAAAFLARVASVYEQPDREVREEVLMKDGRVYERFGAPILDSEKKRLGWVWTFRNITERKRAEDRLVLLAEISETTRAAENAEELLFAVAQAVGEHLRVRRCLFNEIDLEQDCETVHRDYCHGVESVAGTHRISDYSSTTSADMVAGKTVVNNDSKTDPRTADDYERIYAPNGERAYITIPLLRENRWVASLWVSDDEPRQWSAQEISLLETIAERTWTAIEKLRIDNDLRESEQRLQLAIDISRISTFHIDLKTDAVETDDTGRAIYGFKKDEPLTFTKIQSRFHPDDAPEVARRVQAAFAPETDADEFEVEQRIIRTDGDVRWIRVRGRAFFEGTGAGERQAVICLGTYIDITSSKRNEESLLERERLALLNADVSRALIKNDSLPEILRRCTEAVVKHLDAAFARIWTLNRKENVLELQASSGIYTHTDGEHSRVPVGRFKIGIIAEERKPHLTNSVVGDVRVGDQEWAKREAMVAFAGYPLLVEDRLVGVVAMFARHPLTEKTIESLAVAANAVALGIERKQTESERERLLVSEQQARETAEEANRAKDEFIALVSHELRSPLNAMLGWTRILQEQKPDEKTKNYALDVIVRNARSQSRLIEDLLDIARVSKGKLRIEMEPTELAPIINSAVEIIKPAAEAGGVNLTQTLDRAADFITGDADRLRQVIENLLANAVKFTASGGSIEIRLECDEDDAKITISDTGQGISPEFLPLIFERFKQADPSTTRRHGGLGIGLSLARDLVELHGGAISAASAGEGKGATFTVKLPLRKIPSLKENSDKVKSMDGKGKLSGFWILAVDDEADARELVSFMLQINGAKVTTANSAVEALDILKSTEGRLPDILLSDISMPNESGYALLEKIRALPREHGGQIPAVALTAFSRPEDREAAYEAGFQKHLGKPVEPEDLISAIIETANAK